MLEKFKDVNNPLTIVAIFAGLIEIIAGLSLTGVQKNLQPYVVAFLLGFPILLSIAFFLTLNFNPHVLYGPSDYENDSNFLNALSSSRFVDNENAESGERIEYNAN